MNNPIFEVTTNKPFIDTVSKVQKETMANGFRVLHIHDVQATLFEKGFEIKPLKIIEVCNAKYAYTALQVEISVSLLMPCRINVYELGEKTVISTFRPTSLVQMFPYHNLEQFAKDVENVLTRIIENSK